MPAAALDVNWEAIRAHAVTYGVRAAAEAFGIAPGTLTARSCREGWLQPAREAAAAAAVALPVSMQPKAVNAVKPHIAAVNALQTMGEKSKAKLARATMKAATKLASMPGEAILNRTSALKDLAGTGKVLHDWGQSEQASLVIHLGAANPPAVPADPIDMLRDCAAPVTGTREAPAVDTSAPIQ
jgi:hypothetical protein